MPDDAVCGNYFHLFRRSHVHVSKSDQTPSLLLDEKDVFLDDVLSDGRTDEYTAECMPMPMRCAMYPLQ
jgi:hypothetical protein